MAGTVADTKEDEQQDSPPVAYGTLYELLSCPKCEQITMRSGFWHDGMEPEEWSTTIIYPSERPRIQGLPPDVEREFRAAEQVAPISANAYAVLLGRVLDAVCDDRNASGKSLHERLTDLATRQEIPGNLVGMAHNLRQLRNVGAHANLGDLTTQEVPVLEALCRAVLEYVYAAPKLVERVERLVAKLKGT
ncbi:MAG: DUF4145 domain-containing protein [Polyangiaceae bacterium]